ncbi:MAG: DUF4143 domain-containing protein [Candidatus Methanoplasma sp.]|jgi:predicted AAA+ superfamily ATPase|nr:DUF4143 domain-containing protein [Candidatus Methanoplasma sp.]
MSERELSLMESRALHEYRPRIADARIEGALKSFGGVLITGPKWCGKSWTGFRHAKSAVLMDTEESIARAKLAPYALLDRERPLLVDEWQFAPETWDAARRMIDAEGAPGMFIFTGSSSPPDKRPLHSGTGRFARVRMRTLSLFESGDSDGSVSLSALFRDGRTEPVLSEMCFERATELICRGGWPGEVWSERAGGTSIAEEYLASIAESELSGADGTRRSPAIGRAILRSLARNSASPVKATTLREDMARNGNLEVCDHTVRKYADALKDIYVLCEQEAWSPSLRSKTRARTSPKLHLTDPSLAAAAIGASPRALMGDPRTAGLLFESLCYRDLCVYAEGMGGRVHHFRDENGFEIDDIVVLGDGRWGAIEVKLGSFEFDKAAKNLLRLRDGMSDGAAGPSFLAILSASGGVAHTRDDGVTVVPIDRLGP